MQVGALSIEPVHDGVAVVDPGDFLAGPPGVADPWAAHRRFLEPDGKLAFALGGFLVRTGDRLVLVDTGVGRLDRGGFSGGALLDSLRSLGVAPDDITDVVLTHLHFDHVGWTTSKGEVVFPRAVYRCHEADWAHFVERPGAEAGAVRKLSPLEDRLEPFPADGAVAPGVDVRHAPGHTPGSTVIVVSSGAERALLLGDVLHCPVELTEEGWTMIHDVDPDLAARTREALGRELEGTGVPAAAAHFPGMRFGRLLAARGRRRWTFDGA